MPPKITISNFEAHNCGGDAINIESAGGEIHVENVKTSKIGGEAIRLVNHGAVEPSAPPPAPSKIEPIWKRNVLVHMLVALTVAVVAGIAVAYAKGRLNLT